MPPLLPDLVLPTRMLLPTIPMVWATWLSPLIAEDQEAVMAAHLMMMMMVALGEDEIHVVEEGTEILENLLEDLVLSGILCT